MRRPSSVLFNRADGGEKLAFVHALPNRELLNAGSRKMPVEREKFLPILRGVPQDHDWSVIKRRSVVGDGVNLPLERRANIRARRDEKVDAEVDRASFVRGITAAAEQSGRVEGSRLIVTAHADCRIDPL